MIEEIENMFASEDRELRRLAQKLCHANAITYYIFYKRYRKYNVKQLKPFTPNRLGGWVVMFNTTGELDDITYENQYKIASATEIFRLKIHKIDYSWRKSKK